MESGARRSGRPRGFDRDAAVAVAQQLFRRHGYEGVSLAMLTDAIGVAAPSLYAAFGSKAGMYREALDRYTIEASLTLVEAHEPDITLDEALNRMFDRAIMLVAGRHGERGCMVSTGLLASHPDHHELADELTARRGAMAERLGHELEQWLPCREAGVIARFLCTILQGMAIQARDGADVNALSAIAAIALSGILCRVEQITALRGC